MDRDEEGAFGVVPGEDPPDRPRVVDEAHEVLSTYSWQLVGSAAAVAAAWLATVWLEIAVPELWAVPILLVLLFLYIVPVTREPRLAREVLRRWDRLRVERALESSGISGDPRLEVAEAMADRIVRHPSVDARVRDAARTLFAKLRLALRDLRRVEYLTDARATLNRTESSRSISDLQDLLDARVAEVLGQLAELHSTVVLRDAASLERVMGRVEELVHELEAEREVERLLTDAERS
jgi:hypothetical protein